MRFSIIAAGTALAVGLVSAAGAQTPQASPSAAPVCTGAPVIPAEYSAWSTKAPLASAHNARELPRHALVVGRAVTASLLPTPEVQFASQSERPGGSVSKSGMFSLHIAQAGTYYIALGGPPWIDIMKAGTTTGLESVAHGHGPDCSGIRKIVDFRLEPGDYVIQIAGSGQPTLDILVGKRL